MACLTQLHGLYSARSVDLPSSEKTLELQEQIDKLEGAMANTSSANNEETPTMFDGIL